MIRQIATRLNTTALKAPPGGKAPVPVLLLETRPPDTQMFNRADYYRTALTVLGEPFFERRVLVDIEAEATWEKRGRKTARFQDAPELRHALEDAIRRYGVRAVILDEAQHLTQVGTGAKLLDQLDWIKSMTNVTEVLHILLGTYDLLAFRNLSGQASRRSLDIHFARYQFQQEQDRRDFQAVLLALLKQVPLNVACETLMQHWPYFYERSIGCVGVLKDWLIRAVATALHDGSDTLTLPGVQEHALSAAQCERMAIEATEGEQALCYTEQRQEHLWSLLHMGPMPAAASPNPVTLAAADAIGSPPVVAPITRRKRATKTAPPPVSEPVPCVPPVPPKTRPRKKAVIPSSTPADVLRAETAPAEASAPQQPATSAKRPRRVGERNPVRDAVG